MPIPTPILPTAPIDGLASECALIAIGLNNILAADVKWDLTTRSLAANLPKLVRKYLQEFVSKEERRDTAKLPKFDYSKVMKLLDTGTTPKQAEALAKAVQNTRLGLAIAADATRIVHALQTRLPRSNRQTSTGPVVGEPPPTMVADFARGWQVAGDPLVVLVDLVEGSLSQDQIGALENFYPNFFQLVETITNEVVAKMKAKRGINWSLDDNRDRLLGMLLGKTDGGPDMSLAADFQALYNAPKGPSNTTPVNPSINFKSNLGTPGQTGNAS